MNYNIWMVGLAETKATLLEDRNVIIAERQPRARASWQAAAGKKDDQAKPASFAPAASEPIKSQPTAGEPAKSRPATWSLSITVKLK